jgi:hypothetical protein
MANEEETILSVHLRIPCSLAEQLVDEADEFYDGQVNVCLREILLALRKKKPEGSFYEWIAE